MSSREEDLSKEAAALTIKFMTENAGENPVVIFGFVVGVLRVLTRELPLENRLSLMNDIQELVCPELPPFKADGVLH